MPRLTVTRVLFLLSHTLLWCVYIYIYNLPVIVFDDDGEGDDDGLGLVRVVVFFCILVLIFLARSFASWVKPCLSPVNP